MKLKFFLLFFFCNLCYSAPNILLIIGDDMGNETLASYGLNNDTATTATLDQLANEGIRFNNFWTQPVCSPTRATLLTGRYGFRTGIGRPAGGIQLDDPPPLPAWAAPSPPGMRNQGGLGPSGGQRRAMGAPLTGIEAIDRVRPIPRPGLDLDEYTLPKAFDNHLNYKTAAIGKWHLGGINNGAVHHPNLVGFDHAATLPAGAPENYFSWNKVVNGEVAGTVGYTPVDKTNDAINWIAEQEDNPWFLWLAFNLVHTPLHLSPEEGWQSDSPNNFKSMLEAMDTQIGRVLDSLSTEVRANTYVIFMGDNGTAATVISPPFSPAKSKGSIFQGGINVPLIITGPDVPNGVSDALVNSTDLFTTIMEMAGIDPEEAVPEDVTTDSVSFLPILKDLNTPSQREWVYADEFFGSFEGIPTADYAMRDHRYKLLRYRLEEHFYDLQEDPYEHNNLLEGDLTEEQSENYLALKQQIETLRNSE